MDAEQMLEQLITSDVLGDGLELAWTLSKVQDMAASTEKTVRDLSVVKSQHIPVLHESGATWMTNTKGFGWDTGEGEGSKGVLSIEKALTWFAPTTGRFDSSKDLSDTGISGGLMGQALGRIFQLFGAGRERQEDIELERYSWRRGMNPVEALSRWGTPDGPVDYDAPGLPRTLNSSGAGAQRVEIRIEALDARSLLDRSEELAAAVRQAVISAGGATEPYV